MEFYEIIEGFQLPEDINISINNTREAESGLLFEDDSLWRISSAFGLDKALPIYSLDCELALADIYKRVKNLGDKDSPLAF